MHFEQTIAELKDEGAEHRVDLENRALVHATFCKEELHESAYLGVQECQQLLDSNYR